MKKRLRCILILSAVVLVCAAVIFEAGLGKNLRPATESLLQNECTAVLNRAVGRAAADAGDLSEMLTVEKNEAGVISYLYLNESMLNEMTVHIVTELSRELEQDRGLSVGVHWGDLAMNAFCAGRGPLLRLKVRPVSAIDTDIETNLSAAGINQVLFHAEVRIKARVEVLLGLHSYQTEVTRTVPMCDIIIVGSVPQTYADLTEETDFLNLMP